jgi:hypothetical protein
MEVYGRVRHLSILYKLLYVLMTARLLLPPGICICQSSAATARLLAEFLRTGMAVPTPEAEEDDRDDHAPGCPASKLSTGMGLLPATVLSTPDQPFTHAVPSADADAAPSFPAAGPVWPLSWPPGRSLYLTVCSLRI